MNKEYFLQLAKYNAWANAIVSSWLHNLNDAQWEQPLISSFASIKETVLHIAGTEIVWCQRMQQIPTTVLPNIFTGPNNDLLAIWLQASHDLELFVTSIEEDKLQEHLPYTNLKGDPFNQPFYQILAHVFNHSTYHRGQLVTMLRQVGFTALSSTDLITFYRQQPA